MSKQIVPNEDLEKLGDLISYLIAQRELSKPISAIKQTSNDLKILVKTLITRYYLPLPEDLGELFMADINDYLGELREELLVDVTDERYCDYCIDRILFSFEKARELKVKALDLDFKPKLKIVEPAGPQRINHI